MKPSLLGLLAFVVLLRASAGDEWPEFRGPTAQGHAVEAKLPSTWSPTENVVWKVAVTGSGWSSPVHANGKIFLTSAVPQDESNNYELRALCLAADSGAEQWNSLLFEQKEGQAPAIHTKNSHASPTPIVRDGRLYVHFGHQGTACLDLDGNVLWRKTVAYPPVHGNGGSPVLVGDRLIFSCDGAADPFVVALDAETGEERWRTARSGATDKTFSFTTPLVVQLDGQQQLISPGSNGVWAYNPETGRELWKVAYEGYSVIPRPVLGHGHIYLSSGYDSPKLLAIRVDGKGAMQQPHVAWTLSRGAPNTPSPLLVGDELYVVSDRGIASCLDARTGEVHWQQRIGGNFSASPIYADGRIYLQDEQGVGTVIAAAKEFEKLGTNDLQEATLASYAVLGDSLLIRTDKHLYRIGTKKE